jgi:integrase
MQGSIRKYSTKSGVRYLVLVDLGPDPVTGKRRQPSKSFRTKKDAEAALAQWVADIERGTAVDSSKITVSEYLSHWLAAKEWKSNRTREDYTEVCERYLIPTLGAIKLSELRPPHIEKMLAALRERGLKRRRLYAYQVLRAALNKAERAGEIARNPIRGVEAPSSEAVTERPVDHGVVDEDAEEVRALSHEEAGRFLTAAETGRHAALFALALDSGMRPGEYLALRWADLSDDCRTVRVRSAVEVLDAGPKIKNRLKTKLSRRTIPLAPGTAELLRAHKVHQAAERLMVGAEWKDMGLVFANERGGLLDYNNLVRRHFKPLLKAAGIDSSHRLYNLRHTCATLLLQDGENVVTVSRRLGHSKVSQTLDTYAHCLEEHQEIATDRVQRMLFGERRAV